MASVDTGYSTLEAQEAFLALPKGDQEIIRDTIHHAAANILQYGASVMEITKTKKTHQLSEAERVSIEANIAAGRPLRIWDFCRYFLQSDSK